MPPIRKTPMNTCSTMYGWKYSTNMMWWIDRLNIINSHRTKLTVVNKGLDKKETCGWQNTYLPTLTCCHTDTGAKFTLTTTGSSDMRDFQIT